MATQTARVAAPSGREGAGKSVEHGIVTDIQCGELQSFGECGRGNQVVTEADLRMGPAVVAHERRCPPSHLFADLEPLHAAEQADDFTAPRRAHPPAISVRLTTLMASGPEDCRACTSQSRAAVLPRRCSISTSLSNQDHASASRSR